MHKRGNIWQRRQVCRAGFDCRFYGFFSGEFSFSTRTIASILSGALGKKIVDGNFMKNITELLEGCLE